MTRIGRLGLIVLGTIAAATAGALAQGPPTPPPPPDVRRDVAPPQRDPAGQGNVRRIPIGTGVISGTVTVADTGLPVRNARVTVSGTTRASESAMNAPAPSPVTLGRGGGTGYTGIAAPGSSGSMSFSRSVMTDAQGQFTFPKLPAGQFSLTATRNQYLAVTYGQRRPMGQGTTIQLGDGQQLRTNLRMLRGGVISGTVIGPDGDPQPYVQIRAWRYMMNNGFKRLQQMGGASTDDRGTFRLAGLQPGEYLVSATPSNSDLMSERTMADSIAVERAIVSGTPQPPIAPGLPPTVTVQVAPQPTGPQEGPPGFLQTYYPGTLMASQATAVTIAGNDERAGVDISVMTVPASTIQGTVVTPLAQGVAVQVALMPEDSSGGMTSMQTRVLQEGRFTFRGIAPGRYTILAQTVVAAPQMTIVNGVPQPPQPAAPQRLDDNQRMWGRTEASVDGPTPISVSIALSPGRAISGTVNFEMDKPPDLARARMTVTLMLAPSAQMITVGAPPQAQIGADGRFTLVGVTPGQYTLRAGGGIMKSAIVGGQDTLDFPLDFTAERDIADAVLTVTDKSSELSGMLTDPAGKPAVDFSIVVAPSDPRFWRPGGRRVLVTRPDTSGKYTFRSLPPGDYMLAAVTDLEQGSHFDPEFLKALSGGSVRVMITEGAKATQDLRVGR